MRRFPACAALIGVALLIGFVPLPNGSHATADVTGDPIDPAQPLPEDSTTTTICNSPCSGQKECGTGDTACCCRPSVTGSWSCACKDAYACGTDDNCQ